GRCAALRAVLFAPSWRSIITRAPRAATRPPSAPSRRRNRLARTKSASAQAGPAVGPDRGLRPGRLARVVITAPGGREKRSRPRDGAPSGGEVTMTTTTEAAATQAEGSTVPEGVEFAHVDPRTLVVGVNVRAD